MAMVRGSVAKTSAATVIVASDGSGDFTDIQEAIDSLTNPPGGVVYIKEGEYNPTTSIVIDGLDHIAVRGSGRSTLIETGGATDFSLFDFKNAPGFLVENIRFNGPNIAITFNNCDISAIKNNWFFNSDGTIVYENGSDEGQILGNHFQAGNGIAISFDNSDDTIIANNTIIASRKEAIKINNSDNIIISTNRIRGWGDNITNFIGLSIVSSNRCVVNNNVIGKGFGHGLVLDRSTFMTINGNVITDNVTSGDGIRIESSASTESGHNTITGNVITNNAGYGIREVGDDTNDNIILGNICNGNTAGQLLIVGSRTIAGFNVINTRGNIYHRGRFVRIT